MKLSSNINEKLRDIIITEICI